MCSVERVQLCSVALGLLGGIRFRVEGGSSYKLVLSRLYRGPQHFSFIGEKALRSGQRAETAPKLCNYEDVHQLGRSCITHHANFNANE